MMLPHRHTIRRTTARLTVRHVATRATLAAWCALATLAACRDATGPTPDAGNGRGTGAGPHPGFDIGVYPGDAAVRAWASAAPYEWMGYYLPAPCHRDTTFVGRRATIAATGLGVAVIYVGQQTWDGVALVDPAASRRTTMLRAAASAATCSRTLLDAAQGTAEGDDAVARAAADGFPSGTVLYLDLEPMTITDAMRSYYRAWAARVAASGRYRPGIYAHVRNAAAIHTDVGDVPFWVASTSGFTLGRAPTDVGLAFATAWQGALDVSRTWGGVTLRVDESVADRRSPSGG